MGINVAGWNAAAVVIGTEEGLIFVLFVETKLIRTKSVWQALKIHVIIINSITIVGNSNK